MGNQSAKGHKLINTKVSEVIDTSREVVTLSPTTTFQEALLIFKEHNILSAPVINDDGVCKGFFAMDDVIIHLDRVSKKSLNLDGSIESPHVRSDQSRELEHRAHLFLSCTVQEAIDAHRGTSMFLGVKADQTIKDALMLFAKGVQRIAVFNSSKQIIAILSQSTLLRYISQNFSLLEGLENEPAAKLGIAWARVVKINASSLVVDAVSLMHEKCVYALPIVDDNEKIVSHISMSDLKRLSSIDTNTLAKVLESTYEYVKEIRASRNLPANNIISVPSTATIKEVVTALIENHVHQLYLVAPNIDHPVSIISMTNVCHKIFEKHVILGNSK